MSMELSIIVSTYNRPKALEIVLRSLCIQIDQACEIIVADDGSTKETFETVNRIRSEYPSLYIRHVWQPDEGFRLARIRNLAVQEARSEYLIFLDGDCVASPNFIKYHKTLREVGWIVYGQRILTSKKFCERIENFEYSVESPRFWSKCNFLKNRILNNINRILPALYIPLNSLRKINPKKWQKIRGCNWAIWKKDYLRVNGSDETFYGWGSEDKDLAVRLLNAGVQIKSGIFGPYVLHLWHPIVSRDDDKDKIKKVIERLENGQTLPEKGIYN